MKFLLALLFTIHACAPALAAPTRTVQADQIQTPDLTKLFTFPSASTEFVGTSTPQTLTNKTLTAPIISTISNTGTLTLPTSTDTLVGRATTDTLTNKTLTSPTINSGTLVTPGADIITFTEQGLTPSTPAAGARKLYAKTTGKFYQLNSSGVETELGSGSGGTGVNFVVGGDAESGSIWATYADAAGTIPVDGTGGIPSITSASTSATSPLSGANSFLLPHPAMNTQGNGWSYDFTIDNANKAKVLTISFDYLISSGTFVAGSTSVDSDITVWIYDVTNAQLIQPSSYKLLSNSASTADKFSATFQTASNSTSYRLILHNGKTTATAFTIKLDSLQIGPSNYVYGTPITAWQSYTPTWTGSGGTPSLGNGTLNGRWRRVGQNAEIQIYFAFGSTTAPNSSTVWLFSYPSGVALDTASLADGGSSPQGTGLIVDSGTALFTPMTLAVPAGIRHYVNNTSNAIGYQIPMTWTNGDSLTSTITLPVVGWGASTQMSDQTETRQINFVGTSTGVVATANVTNIPFTAVKDSVSAWSGSVYTVQTPGDYDVSGFLSGPSTCSIDIYLNGSQHRTLIYLVGSSGGSGAVTLPNLKAGDTISIRSNVGQTFASSTLYTLSIARKAGPATIAATESISARYVSTAGNAVGTSNAIYIAATRDFDTHGAYNTSTGLFTCPISGEYEAGGRITATVNLATNQSIRLYIYKNGSQYSEIGRSIGSGVSADNGAGGSDKVRCNAGETLAVWAVSGVATTTLTLAGFNYIWFRRVGN